MHQRRIAVAAAGLFCGWLALTASVASAQDTAPPPAPSPMQAAPPAEKPGVLESIGRWFDQSASRFNEHLRGAKRKFDELGDDAAANSKDLNDKAAAAGKNAAAAGRNAAEATQNAMEAVTKLPTARMMSGRERCVTAPNGAPDCVTAAEALCRKHGFATGKSMDFTSAEECPAKTLLGQASRDECATVTFISRAMCQ
jgi:hypothetical protein